MEEVIPVFEAADDSQVIGHLFGGGRSRTANVTERLFVRGFEDAVDDHGWWFLAKCVAYIAARCKGIEQIPARTVTHQKPLRMKR